MKDTSKTSVLREHHLSDVLWAAVGIFFTLVAICLLWGYFATYQDVWLKCFIAVIVFGAGCLLVSFFGSFIHKAGCKLSAIFVLVAVIILGVGGIILYIRSNLVLTVEDATTSLTYGQSPDLSGAKFYITNKLGYRREIEAEPAYNKAAFSATGEQSLTVTMTDPVTNKPYSTVLSFSISKAILSSPADGTTNGFVVLWSAVSNAEGYILYIGEQTVYNGSNTFAEIPTSLLLSDSSPLEFSVFAYGRAENYIDSSPYIFSVSLAPQISGLVIQSGVLEWDAISGAAYQVLLDGQVVASQTTNQFTIGSLTAGTHTFNVTAVVQGSLSRLSDALTVTKLAAPNLSISNETIVGADAATALFLDGVPFDGDFSTVTGGNHILTAKRVAQNPAQLDSNLSDGYAFTKLTASFNYNLISGTPQLRLYWTADADCMVNLKVSFYKDGSPLDITVTYPNLTGTYQNITYVRSGVTADRVVAEFTLVGNGSTLLTSVLILEIII